MRKIGCLVSLMLCFAAAGVAAPLQRHSKAIPGRFIVLLNPTPAAAFNGIVNSLAATYELEIKTRWNAFEPRGFFVH